MHNFILRNGNQFKGVVTEVNSDKLIISRVGNDTTWVHPVELRDGFALSNYVKSILASVLGVSKFDIFHNGHGKFWVENKPDRVKLKTISLTLKPVADISADIGKENTIFTVIPTITIGIIWI